MKPVKIKLFNRTYLILAVLLVFVINHLEIIWLSSRFNWEDQTSMFILGKSVTTSLIVLTWFFVIPIIVKVKKRFPQFNKLGKHLLIQLVISIFLSIIVDFIAELMTMGILFLGDKSYAAKYAYNYFGNIDLYLINIRFLSIAIYWLILIYLSSEDFYLKFKSEAEKRAEAENLITKAELNALKMQLQPHFLFNTLHSISSLIDINKEEAQDVIGRLGDLLRYTLDQHKNDFISLNAEIEFIKNYLEVEKARFKDRLTVCYEIEKETETMLIANFILQPLIENAIKHGLSKTNQPCTITITSSVKNSQLNIKITDNGKGSESIQKGVGLKNTAQRLATYFGNTYEFAYQNIQPHGFQVIMKLPINYNKESI